MTIGEAWKSSGCTQEKLLYAGVRFHNPGRESQPLEERSSGGPKLQTKNWEAEFHGSLKAGVY